MGSVCREWLWCCRVNSFEARWEGHNISKQVLLPRPRLFSAFQLSYHTLTLLYIFHFTNFSKCGWHILLYKIELLRFGLVRDAAAGQKPTNGPEGEVTNQHYQGCRHHHHKHPHVYVVQLVPVEYQHLSNT